MNSDKQNVFEERRRAEPDGSEGAISSGCREEKGLSTEKCADPAESPVPHRLLPGSVFDKYRIISFEGAGGMGEVYKAEHLLLKRFFALKVMKGFDAGHESAAAKRFLREAKCFNLLDHPNIVRVFDTGCDKSCGLLYIAMEYLEGGTLAEVKEKLSEDELLKVAQDMAQALGELERNRMVHRDIKPSNIMRDSQGNCKLMDLGIVRNQWEKENVQTLTLGDCIIGTPAYASPEQCRSPHDVDIRSDIYSLGATLYFLAGGVQPFKGESPLDTIMNVIHKEPPELKSLTTKLSDRTVRLIECMMEKNPERRPRNAAELLRMIEAVRRKEDLFLSPERFRKKTFLSAAALLLILISAAAFWGFPGSGEASLESAPEQIPSDETLPETESGVPQKAFLQKFFISTGEPRTLKVRIGEFEKIIAFLNSPESEGISFRYERKELFVSWKAKLETFLKRKEERQKRRTCVSPAPEFRQEIEAYLQKKHRAFHQDPEGVELSRKIISALQAGEIDPDIILKDRDNKNCSLTGLALSGRVPLYEPLLKTLIFAGADIDAGYDSVLSYSPGRIGANQLRLTGIMAFNGADNIDTWGKDSQILRAFDPPRPYITCLPSRRHIDWELIELLVESGARLDVKDHLGRNVLHWAALRNRGELLNKLLLAGAPGGVDRDRNGDTPFQLAVKNHASSASHVLMRFGLSTPLTLAERAQGALYQGITSNTPLQVEQALDSGASLEYTYANKFNALQNAVLYRRKDLVKFLLNRGASLRSSSEEISLYNIAICAVAPEVFKVLLENEVPPGMSVQGRSFRTWLPEEVLAHFRRRADIAKKYFDAMLVHGWDINEVGPGGMNLLERALLFKDIHIDMIRYLLQKGADPSSVVRRKKIDLKRLSPQLRELIAPSDSK